MNTYQQLAQDLGVSLTDFMCFAQSVADSIEKDGMTKIFAESSAEERTDIAKLYAEEANKKFQQFVLTYFKKNGAKEAFINSLTN